MQTSHYHHSQCTPAKKQCHMYGDSVACWPTKAPTHHNARTIITLLNSDTSVRKTSGVRHIAHFPYYPILTYHAVCWCTAYNFSRMLPSTQYR
eukprot:12986-Heterococcus_DN1.PRE.1